MFKRLFYVLFVVFFLNGCYLAKQGFHILKFQFNAEDIDRLINDENTHAELREFLLLVKEIKNYAVEEIGLEKNKNYTRYVELEKDYLVDVVSACEKDRFAPYRWAYPFFGKFPYKGFFVRDYAEREAKRLERKGYDVIIRRVDAFSTLGFFTDPVYSFMTEYSLYQIASLIIHELTHSTIFLKNYIEFNERLATFVGEEGARTFIEEKYGMDSEHYREAVDFAEDFNRFVELIQSLYGELSVVYASGLRREEKLEKKEKIIRAFNLKLKSSFHLFKTERFMNIQIPVNNAYIMTYMRYTEDLSLFYELYEKNSRNLNRMVKVLKGLIGYKGDPEEYLKKKLSDREEL